MPGLPVTRVDHGGGIGHMSGMHPDEMPPPQDAETLPSVNSPATDGPADAAPAVPDGGPGEDGSTAPAEARPGRRRRGSVADLARGVETIKGYLRTLPDRPGVYRMLSAEGDVLYVGKARNLKRRVTNYTQVAKLPVRLQRMVAETVTMEFVTTHTEVEALLLESNLIKRLMPRYNVLLRDDKSFPHILITGDHPFPQLTKHRGARDRAGSYYGPFASAGAVNRVMTALQRAFQIRTCTDTVFASRTRPCLQFQIKRCTAPCVGRVGDAGYAAQVAEAKSFLSGRSSEVQARLARAMQDAAEALEFETAAKLRDRIRALTAIQAHQDINVEGVEDADVIAAHQDGGVTCIQVFFFRGGRNYGNRAYFPSHDKAQDTPEVLSAFVAQFYENKAAPELVLVSEDLPEHALLQEALSVRAGHRVALVAPKRGDKRRVVDHALTNAREAHGRRLAESGSQAKLLAGVAEVFGLAEPPQRIEVYDNSHIQGTNAVGGMIVAGPEGFLKSAYRKFNIKDPAAAGDDYAMMREVLTRRFERALKEDPERTGGTWPDLLLIDGGEGQLAVALEVLAELGIDDVPLAGIAKGPDRDAGRERFFLPGRPPFGLDPKSPVLYYLQRLRDEAHRFAIGTHRARREKALGASPLDEIAGIGPRRKKALLHHFGSARAVSRAGLQDLASVEGISEAVARIIYDHFHPDG
ncbi:excinuclease ABC, C subunit, putative [Rhodospirillum centenum SW]|uniref:UvrABC system protein C n=2 Tax=Rhodospirillum centenum TaxID=34018 RepID=B6INU7_RHOCS|nr:excinuclease ABC subunit UvrC [Rhodospirillum centenum]ACI99281.1 excinuclease ABC, C subunit, putative [Rhodospirillum centenum SW]